MVTVIVSAFTFISLISSSIITPAIGQLAVEFGITDSVVKAMITSTFVLAFAVGPLFLGPLSELYGCSIMLQASNLFVIGELLPSNDR